MQVMPSSQVLLFEHAATALISRCAEPINVNCVRLQKAAQAFEDLMTTNADVLVGKIRSLELELDAEFAKQRAGLGFGMEHGRTRFDEELVRRQIERRIPLGQYLLTATPLVVLTAPLIYGLIVPFVLVDLGASLFQAICFRVYGIAQVRRSRYLIFDRAGLAYLNALEKLNCCYCSYVNGVIGYVREMAARTEQFWCPIKHARRVIGAHPRYAIFGEYGDGQHYHEQLQKLQIALRDEFDHPTPNA